jgi:ABC-type arginine transport system ATPase subunit
VNLASQVLSSIDGRRPATIRKLAEHGMTWIIVTHEIAFTRQVADQIYCSVPILPFRPLTRPRNRG